jgi:hypothetical protein
MVNTSKEMEHIVKKSVLQTIVIQTTIVFLTEVEVGNANAVKGTRRSERLAKILTNVSQVQRTTATHKPHAPTMLAHTPAHVTLAGKEMVFIVKM